MKTLLFWLLLVACGLSQTITAPGNVPVIKRLDVDAADIISNITPAMNGTLQFAAGAGEEWVFEGTLCFTEDSLVPGMSFSVATTHAMATGFWTGSDDSQAVFLQPIGGVTGPLDYSSPVAILPSGAQSAIIHVSGSFKMGVTASVVGISIAQANTSTAAIRLLAGSYIIAHKK